MFRCYVFDVHAGKNSGFPEHTKVYNHLTDIAEATEYAQRLNGYIQVWKIIGEDYFASGKFSPMNDFKPTYTGE